MRGARIPAGWNTATSAPTAHRVKNLSKARAKGVTHSKYVLFQLAEVAVRRQLFAAIVERISRLRLVYTSCRGSRRLTSGREGFLARSRCAWQPNFGE
jgi:hypothetical protein